ncbi:MAG: dihydropteroate synthase [Phycisphaerales bacterium]|nr:dihydropteroate synthase [Phycisphaerae bacterium]NNM27859.1 dihydropteroate synthase [Phycisphaerales bacterium]
MGIVNATPDSFSDGGLHRSVPSLVGAALRCVEEGAAIIDIGGESTRPGADRVDADEQIERVVPFIIELRSCTTTLISIDTTNAAVAEAALDAGANLINDVSAGRDDPRMLPLAATRGCGLVLMHRRVPPAEDRYSDRYDETPDYDDVVRDVGDWLGARALEAEAAGVARAAIVIDPGLGFGKSVEQNYELIAGTAKLVGRGYPVLSAASRKSFIGAVSGVETPRDRVVGSTAVSVAHALAGVRLFRVHDVAAHRRAVAVAMAIARSGGAIPRPVG